MSLPVKIVDSFAGQNWLITPAAPAVNDPPLADVSDQKWLLTLSGVGMVNLEGNSTDSWLQETLLLEPTIIDPIHYAIGHHSIPRPPGTEGVDYSLAFQVEQLAPFASLSSVFNAGESINSGFAVDAWRPNHWGSGIEAVTHEYLTTLYTGLKIDVAVRDTDAWIYRIGYSIALLGKIVFVSNQKVLFESNFDPTAVGQPPSPTQEVGTSAVEGSSVTVVDSLDPDSNDKWVRLVWEKDQDVAALHCLLTESPGPGTYLFAAELLLSGPIEEQNVASISFETANGEEFLHVDFLLENNTVRVDDVGAEFGSFPTDAAFLVQVALNIQDSGSTATVALSGSASGSQEVAVKAPFQQFAPQFGAAKLWKGFGNTGAFDATNVVVSRSLD